MSEPFCDDCPDHEACATGWACKEVRYSYQKRKRELMRDYDQPAEGMDRPQSKIDDAFSKIEENFKTLRHTITDFENRLKPITNDYPRATFDGDGGVPDEKPTPSGDSPILLRLYSFIADLQDQEERLRSAMSRIDI